MILCVQNDLVSKSNLVYLPVFLFEPLPYLKFIGFTYLNHLNHFLSYFLDQSQTLGVGQFRP